MRTAFIQELILAARSNPRLFLAVGDLGYSVVEPFANEFPDRFLNAGVAEQNLTGVAAGLASEGWHVFTYSIANFPTLRCLEQIRNDVVYHQLPVTVVAVGAGMSYGNLGYSHHAVQDIAILRSLASLTVLSPADPGETRECVRWLSANPGPSYLRIGKAGEPQLHAVQGPPHGPVPVRPGPDPVALVASGSILQVALQAADLLAAQGRPVAVYSLPWLHPLDPARLAPLARHPRLVVLEEHLAFGGVASALREVLPAGLQVDSFHVPTTILGEVGSQEYLRRRAGLTPEAVAEHVARLAG